MSSLTWSVVCFISLSLVTTVLCAEDDFLNAQNMGKVKVIELDKSMIAALHEETKQKERLDMYCYDSEWQPLAERLPKAFSAVGLKLNTTGEEFELFSGKNESEVFALYKGVKSQVFRFSLPWQTEQIAMLPFNKTCIGIATRQEYSIRFRIKIIDPTLVGMLVVGVIIFFSARKLSRNAMFYYGTGMSIGILASLLILLFILSRFLPWRKGAYVMLAGGYSVVLWSVSYVWKYYHAVLLTHYQYVLIYIGVTGLISFAILYYKGPVKQPRALNILTWVIQLISILIIYNSTQIQEVSIAIILGLVSIYNFPSCFARTIKWFWRKLVPPRMRLLTEEEYLNQGRKETKRALAQLRDYCKSPDCDAWKVISQLESPARFAKFVEGEYHLSDDEISIYERNPEPRLRYDDSDSEDEIDFRMSSQ